MITIIMILLCKRYFISHISRSSLVSQNLTAWRDFKKLLQFPVLNFQDKFWGEATFTTSLSTVACLIIEHPYLRISLHFSSYHLYFSHLKKNTKKQNITYRRNLCRKGIILLFLFLFLFIYFNFIYF